VSRKPRYDRPITVVLALLLASVVDPGWLGSAGGSAAALAPAFHLVGYAVLGAVVRPAFAPGWRGTLAAVAVVVAVGAGVEGVQAGLPYRTASAADAAINGVGGLLGASVRGFLGRGSSTPDAGP
jgi:hypothetical protein